MINKIESRSTAIKLINSFCNCTLAFVHSIVGAIIQSWIWTMHQHPAADLDVTEIHPKLDFNGLETTYCRIIENVIQQEATYVILF